MKSGVMRETRGGHQVHARIKFVFAGNECLHFPRRNKTDKFTAVISLTRIARKEEIDERNISHSCQIQHTGKEKYLLITSRHIFRWQMNSSS